MWHFISLGDDSAKYGYKSNILRSLCVFFCHHDMIMPLSCAVWNKIMFQKNECIYTTESSKMLFKLIREYMAKYFEIKMFEQFLVKAEYFLKSKNMDSRNVDEFEKKQLPFDITNDKECEARILSFVNTVMYFSENFIDLAYPEKFFLNKRFPELGSRMENERVEILFNIEKLLEQGVNPDSPEIFMTTKGEQAKKYPLQMAVDFALVTLLLKYGADQNIASLLDGNHGNEMVAALEGACKKINYSKIKALLSCKTSKINDVVIEKSLLIMLFNFENKFTHNPESREHSIDFRKNKLRKLEHLDVILALSDRLDEAVLVKILINYIKMAKEVFKEFSKVPQESSDFILMKDDYDLIVEIKNILTHSLNRKLLIPVWLLVVCAHRQDKNELNVFPTDVVKLIMLNLYQLNISERVTNEFTENQIYVFKTIYTIFSRYDSTINLEEINEKKSSEDVFAFIESYVSRCPSIKKMWELSLLHVDNFSSKNDVLLQELTTWALQKSRAAHAVTSLYQLPFFKPLDWLHFSYINNDIINTLNTLTNYIDDDQEINYFIGY